MSHPPSTPQLPPGPRASRLVQTWRFVARPRRSLDDSFARYGDAFTARIFGMGTIVVLSNRAAIRDLFTADPEVVVTGESNRRLFEDLLGANSLLNLDGSRHLRKRKLLTPPFHGQRMHVYGVAMREAARRAMARWRVGQRFAIAQTMRDITLEVILRVIFGVDELDQRERTGAVVLDFLDFFSRPEAAMLGIRAAQLDLGPRSPWGRMLRVRAPLDERINAAIAARRAAGTEGREDILSMLIDARDEDGQPMSDAELRDDLFTLLLVGHETTAASLTWGFWTLLRRPDLVAKIRAEYREVMAGGPLDPGRVGELVYLDAVVKELLRVHPVTDGAARLLMQPTRLGDLHLPAGVMAAASTWLTHHNPALWDQPRRFWPERFLGKKPPAYAWLPFGGGPRRCVGAAFATLEMKIVLSELLNHASLRVEPGYQPKVARRAITLSAAGGVPVELLAPVAAADRPLDPEASP
ncbi:putative cytochrome P450 120 [Enhygromyxa salina]|uniref:Putative cytochrome P450 120 n=1 Tax=Enhygromyxa salina TaxID=215803 RepID=A0A2S9YGI9_9BACT|nr:cytochrome P450 [Enhygromyxa salina]PRQ04162.1 putative cytochrome P450 120 [Enhygromyxa salina]